MNEFIKGYQNQKITALGLGVFDGMHLGHAHIAEQCDALLSFDPHPDMVLNKDKEIKRLSLPTELQQYHPQVFFLAFSKDIAALSAEDFLNKLIKHVFNPKKIIVGYDFQFGHKQSGCTNVLKDWGKQHHIDVIEISPFQIEGLGIIKSAKIRTLIGNGEIEKAISYLGHDYLIEGQVIRGDGRGTSLGFPTANLDLSPDKCLPKPGVYGGSVRLSDKNDKTHKKAIIYIGKKPTFGDHDLSVEVHIPELDIDLYDKNIQVYLNQHIRGEMTFDTPESLTKQIQSDLTELKGY